MPQCQSACAKIGAVKAAEKGKALIVRLFEFRGRGGEAEVSLPAAVKAVSKANLLEREGRPLKLRKDGVCSLKLRPWEIATLRCEL
jgi:alpha-mannosidase